MSNANDEGVEYLERLGQIALRVLQDCAFKAGLDEASGRLQGPERIKKPEAAPERQHTSGSPPATWEELGRDHTAETDRSGLETRGRVGAFRAPDSCNDALSRHQRGNTYRYEFTNAGYSVRVRFTGDARWFGLRAVPRRAWLGGGESPLPRPSSRLHANDNRRHGRYPSISAVDAH